MKKGLLSRIAAAMLCIVMAVGVMTACSPKISMKLSDGGDIPSEIVVELGELCMVPNVTAVQGDTEYEVSVKVADSTGADVKLTNGKFRAESIDGYTVTYTANDKNATKKTVSVRVTKLVAPKIIINMPEGMTILKDREFDVPEYSIADSSSTTLTADITVKHESGSTVTVLNNKFTPDKYGKYTITYAVSDGFGNNSVKNFVVNCEDATVLNPFDAESDITWTPSFFAIEAVTENTMTGKGVKVSCAEAGALYGKIHVPFKTGENSFMSWNALRSHSKLQVYVYSSIDNEFGLATQVWQIKAGKNIVVFNMADIVAIRNATPSQYEESANGFYLNLKHCDQGTYIILDNFIGIKDADYVAPLEITLASGEAVPESETALYGEDYILPAVKAFRGDDAVTVTTAVKDADGEAVTVEEGKFLFDDARGYTVTFTATDDLGTLTKTISVTVDMTNAFRIDVKGADGMIAPYNEYFDIPACTAKTVLNEALSFTVTVKNSDGTVVNADDGKFMADDLGGEYTIRYTISAGDYEGEYEEITVSCEKAVMLNAFDTEDDLGWLQDNPTKSLVAENAISEKGLKIAYAGTNLNYKRICVPLKTNGTYISWENLQKFEKLALYVYLPTAAHDSHLRVRNNTVASVSEGKNVVMIDVADIVTEYANNPNTYESSANGLYLQFGEVSGTTQVVFDSFMGIYARNYVPTVEAAYEIKGIDGMIAVHGEQFTVPACTVTGISDEQLGYNVTVTDADGNSVFVEENKFLADKLGEEYTVRYTVTAEGYEGYEELTVKCEKAVMLNAFDADGDIGWLQDSPVKSVVTENVISAGGIKIAYTAAGNFKRICVPLKTGGANIAWDELKKFEKLVFYVYLPDAESNVYARNANVASAAQGASLVIINMTDLIAEYTSNAGVYEANSNGLYLQFSNIPAGSYVVMDSFMGVYARDYVPTVEADFDIKGIDGMIAAHGEQFTAPVCSVTGTSDEQLTYSVTVTDSNGEAVEVTDGKFLADKLGEEYTVRYTVTSVGYEGYKELTVKCEKAVMLNALDAEGDIGWLAGNPAKSVETENVISAGGIKIAYTAAGNFQRICMPLKTGGANITWDELKKFEKLVFYVYLPDAESKVYARNASVATAPQGASLVTINMTDLIAEYTSNAGVYEANSNGLYLQFSNIPAGSYVVMDGFMGVYARDYQG